MPPEVVIWGGTGQATVVRPIIEEQGSRVVVVIDDTLDLLSPFSDVPIYCGMEGLLSWLGKKNPSGIGFCVAIGNPYGRVRMKLHDSLSDTGFVPISVVHPSAIIASNARIGKGAQIMAGAIIQPEVTIGKQCIINTNASVDHECILEDGVEISPGATLCGAIRVEINAWVGAGAVVLPRLTIGADALVGAGAVVTKSVEPGVRVVGVPARPVERNI